MKPVLTEESLEIMGLKDAAEHYERQFWYYVDRYNRLRGIVAQIINDLPINRDWLDPDLEREVRDILKESTL